MTYADRPSDILVLAPWLEGGGAQKALEGVLARLPREQVHVVTAFAGCRNHEPVRELCRELTQLEAPRSAVGAFRASRSLAPHLSSARVVYSLMRAGHVVLGLLPHPRSQATRLAATFHQLPSGEGSGPVARLESVAIRRGLGSASLVTAPAMAAVAEIRERRLVGSGAELVYEPNLLGPEPRALSEPRRGPLGELRLLFAGRLTDQKGLERLPELLAQCPLPVEVKVAGDGPLMSALRSSFSGASGHHTLELVGRTHDIVPLIDWADAVVMPSRTELSPMFIWEAWRRGRGAIVSNIPAFRELARRGPTLLFDTTDEFVTHLVERVAADAWRHEAAAEGVGAVSGLARNSRLVDFLLQA